MSVIVDNCDVDKHWENKVLQKNGLLLKCSKLEQKEDEDTQFNRSGHLNYLQLQCIIHIYCVVKWLMVLRRVTKTLIIAFPIIISELLPIIVVISTDKNKSERIRGGIIYSFEYDPRELS